jgi:S-(hydroxymethyl)glutathione dehydrogenase/alcohol dehydrogenase
MGAGGVGINAVQGAAHAGASNVIACDPVAFKREGPAARRHAHVRDHGRGHRAGQGTHRRAGRDSAIVTVGVTTGEHIGQAFAAIRKAGTAVVTGVGSFAEIGAPIPLGELTLFQKRMQGSLFGQSNSSWDIPRQIQLYRDGVLKLDELITARYRLDDIATGYEDMHAGKNIRGIISYEN